MSFRTIISHATVGFVVSAGLATLYLTPPHGDLPQRLRPGLRAPRSVQPGKLQSNDPRLQGVDPIGYQAEGPSPISLDEVPRPEPADSPYVRGGNRLASRFTDLQVASAQAAAAAAQPTSAGVQNLDGSFRPVGQKPFLLGGFDAIDASDCCRGTGFAAVVPPDPDLAVGPHHVIVVVNTAFEVFDKSGRSLTGPIQFSTFFDPTRGGTSPGAGTPTPGCSAYADAFGDGRQFGAVFDPDVVYDEQADRFVVGIDGNGDSFCVAASQTGDPTGLWNRYGFPTDVAGAFFDFPHMGVGVDAIYMGSNQFGGSLPFGFQGRVFAMNKAHLYAGTALAVVTRELAPAGKEGPLNLKLDGTPQPAQLHGAAQGTFPTSGPHHIMGEFFDGKSHAVYAWNDPFGANTFDLVGDVDLAAASGVPCEGFSCFPIPWPQKGSPEILQSNDYRGQETEYRNGKLWTTQTISCNPGKGTRNCVRWAQIDPTRVVPGVLAQSGFPLASGTAGVLQAGVIGSDWDHRTFPSLAANHCEDMAIGYSFTRAPGASGGTWYPSIFVAGRQRDEAPGRIAGERLLKKALTPYSSFQDNGGAIPERWGDYTGMTIAPDGQTFWYVGEYARQGAPNPFANWGTFVGAFHYPACQ